MVLLSVAQKVSNGIARQSITKKPIKLIKFVLRPLSLLDRIYRTGMELLGVKYLNRERKLKTD